MTTFPSPDALLLFTVYAKPSDFPDSFVVRRFAVRAGLVERDPEIFGRSPTLEGARALIPPGLYRLGRQDNDDPVIVESWI